MTRYLLDVNILLNLVWKDLDHHALVKSWFASSGQHHFATCPITQAGFLRISSSPRVLPHPATMAEGFDLLSKLTQMTGHEFWPADLPLREATLYCSNKLFGPGQLTDAYLLGLAIGRSGVLVTLDRSIGQLAGTGFAQHVLVL